MLVGLAAMAAKLESNAAAIPVTPVIPAAAGKHAQVATHALIANTRM